MARELSLWLVGALSFVVLLSARELGGLARRWHDRRRGGEDSEREEFSMTSVLGLLALLIGFTFSLSLLRYEERRELVIREANAIGTTWLRYGLLDAPDRDRLRTLLQRYVEARVAFGRAETPAEEAAAYQQTATLQQQLWASTTTALAPVRTTVLAGLVLQPLNESIDIAGTRKAHREAHIPSRLLRLLLEFGVVAAAMIGYQRRRYRTASTLILLLFTLAGTLILDLDRPSSGGITEPQTPMLDLQRSLGPPPSMPPPIADVSRLRLSEGMPAFAFAR
jgi:hypothetical protein